jgi:hypothetical protein
MPMRLAPMCIRHAALAALATRKLADSHSQLNCTGDGTRAACGTARRFGGGAPVRARPPAQIIPTLQRASHRPRHARIECAVRCAWPRGVRHARRGEPAAVERATQLRACANAPCRCPGPGERSMAASGPGSAQHAAHRTRATYNTTHSRSAERTRRARGRRTWQRRRSSVAVASAFFDFNPVSSAVSALSIFTSCGLTYFTRFLLGLL